MQHPRVSLDRDKVHLELEQLNIFFFYVFIVPKSILI